MKSDITPATEIFDDDKAPLAPHTHYWYLSSSKNAFEPVEGAYTADGAPMFKMTEYAYLICKCSAVVKKQVKTS